MVNTPIFSPAAIDNWYEKRLKKEQPMTMTNIPGPLSVRTTLKTALMAAAGLLAIGLPGAKAQTYGNTNFPVCLQNYAPVQYISCAYDSLPECRATASGRAAMCVLNPYFVPPDQRPDRRRRRAY